MEKLAKEILLHPNFEKLSEEEITEVFSNLLANGISKEQIENILLGKEKKNSNLENLSYDAFLLITDNMLGKDLINFCNSSPLINEKCNRDLILSNDKGIVKIIPQFVFTRALTKAKINILPKEIPRRVYIREFVGGKARNFNGESFNVKQLKYVLNFGGEILFLTVNGDLIYNDKLIMPNVKLIVPNNTKFPYLYLDIFTFDGTRYTYSITDQELKNTEKKYSILKMIYLQTHSITLDDDMAIKVVGSSKCGNLGLGPDIRRVSQNTIIPGLNNIVDFDAKHSNTALLDQNGHVWLYGNTHLPEFSTELKNGTSPCSWTPKMVKGLNDVVQISIGYRTYLALHSNGTVRLFGGSTNNPIIKRFYGLIKKANGQIFDSIVKIQAFENTYFMLDNLGDLYFFGYNIALGSNSKGHGRLFENLPDEDLVSVPQLIASDLLNFFYYGGDDLYLID